MSQKLATRTILPDRPYLTRNDDLAILLSRSNDSNQLERKFLTIQFSALWLLRCVFIPNVSARAEVTDFRYECFTH